MIAAAVFNSSPRRMEVQPEALARPEVPRESQCRIGEQTQHLAA
jgi:hypothetical protein